MRKIYFPIAMALVMLALLFGSCKSTPTATTTSAVTSTTAKTTSTSSPTPTTTTATPQYGGMLNIVTGVLPDGIFGYPIDIVNGASVRIAGHCLEGLYKMNADASLTGVLATSWQISDNKTSITFNLRKGVKFMDGSDFNATAVKWNFDNQIAAKKVPAWGSVDVIDDYTVRVNFTSYANTNLQTFADSAGWIVSPTGYQQHGQKWMDANIDSTGAFSISDFTRDVSVTMLKNPNYWQTGKPYLDGIKYTFIPDNDTAWAQMQTGKVDVWWTTPQYVSQAVKQNYTYVGKAGTTMSLIPDSGNSDSPWANLKVRQAADYALNRVAYANAFGYGLTKAPYETAPDTSPAYAPNLTFRTYNIATAKQLLSDAGYPNGFDTQIICQIGSNTNKDEVQAIQSDFAAVGIRAQVNYYETAQYYTYRNATWKNGLLFEPIAAYANYNGTFDYYFGRHATTFFSLGKSAAFYSALDASDASTYPDATLQKAVSTAMFNDAMVIPTTQRITLWMLQPSSKVRDLGLETRHQDLYMNAENAWFAK